MRVIHIIHLFSIFIITLTIPLILFADDERKNRDFGLQAEKLLNKKSKIFFGIKKPLKNSASESTVPYRTEVQGAGEQVLLAKGLHVEYLSRDAGDKTDMIVFFPSDDPTHIITSVESGREEIVENSDKYNPSVQRINLKTGEVETILRGLHSCDGIRLTPWGTILATEEAIDGAAYEILEPLSVTDETVTDRGLGIVTDPVRIVKRNALPIIAWEGIAILPNGVVIAGDEFPPGIGANFLTPDADGGAIYKFIPDVLRFDNDEITDLGDSPLVSGRVYALQINCFEGPVPEVGFQELFGQGCEAGIGSWVEVSATFARFDADANWATGYMRPEDLHIDPMFETPVDSPGAVRFCWTNTGNAGAQNFGEVFCAVDHDPVSAEPFGRTVVANRFVEGDTDFNSFDNLAFQPFTGNLYVLEDAVNGDVFACLRDGADRDIKTDGCIKVISVLDSSAEPTGLVFSQDGTSAYLSIQHSNDDLMPLVDNYPTDDILEITGFQLDKGDGRSNDDDESSDND